MIWCTKNNSDRVFPEVWTPYLGASPNLFDALRLDDVGSLALGCLPSWVPARLGCFAERGDRGISCHPSARRLHCALVGPQIESRLLPCFQKSGPLGAYVYQPWQTGCGAAGAPPLGEPHERLTEALSRL